MLTYSIAIRTLGLGGDNFRRELESIALQTVQPERIIVYIAEGYERPPFTVGREEYVWVKKGMVAQRVLPYKEISSQCIIMLDDDVELHPCSAERMLREMEEGGYDCMGGDIFENHRMTALAKVKAMVTNLVFPHGGQKWAFKIHRNGSFSYINRPVRPCYPSQSCGGGVMLFRKDVYHKMRFEDELWLERLGFTYGEDLIVSHKLYRNGYRLGVSFDAEIKNLDSSTSSGAYRRSPDRMRLRTRAIFIMWWRTGYNLDSNSRTEKVLTAIAFILKTLWMIFVMTGASVVMRKTSYIVQYIQGLREGWQFVHTPKFKSIPNYILPKGSPVEAK